MDTNNMSAQHTPGPVKFSAEESYEQWRELHALNGLVRPREWNELSAARQRVWAATVRSVFDIGRRAAIAKAVQS